MPNANYTKGVVLEREIVNLFKSVGCQAARTAGSHGKYDLYAIGSREQCSLASDKLEIIGFRPCFDSPKPAIQRKGLKYIDTLFIMEISDNETNAVFIQCKRKEKGEK